MALQTNQAQYDLYVAARDAMVGAGLQSYTVNNRGSFQKISLETCERMIEYYGTELQRESQGMVSLISANRAGQA